tara:strand:+ start:5993 stop:7672 length:1680 start_codon:yes stop_codon:yes gene_type:complete
MAKAKSVRSQVNIDNVVQAPAVINPATRVDTYVKPVQNTKGMQVAKALQDVAPSIRKFAVAREASIVEKQVKNIAGTQARIEADGGGYLEHESWDKLKEKPRMMIAEYFGNKTGDEKILEHKNYLSRNTNVLLDEAKLESYITEASLLITAEDSFSIYEQSATKTKLDGYFNSLRQEGIDVRGVENKRNLLDGFNYHVQDILSIEKTAELKANNLPSGWEALENWYQGYVAQGSAITPAEYKIQLFQEIKKGVVNGTIDRSSLDIDRIPTQWKSKEIESFIDILADQADTELLKKVQIREANDKTDIRRTTVEMIQASVNGSLDPNDYQDNPILFKEATRLSESKRGAVKSLITGNVAQRKMMAAFLTDNPSVIGQNDLSFESVAAFIQEQNLYGTDAARLITLVERFEQEPLVFNDFYAYKSLDKRITSLKDSEERYFKQISSVDETELNDLATIEFEDRIIDFVEENGTLNNKHIRVIADEVYAEYKQRVDELTKRISPERGGTDAELIEELQEEIEASTRTKSKQRKQRKLDELLKKQESSGNKRDPFSKPKFTPS